MKFLLQLPAYLYRWLLSPFLHTLCGPGSGCRFEPSCSSYLIMALKQHDLLKGLSLGLRRLARCHPWNQGGYDPVPGCDSRCCDNHSSSKVEV